MEHEIAQSLIHTMTNMMEGTTSLPSGLCFPHPGASKETAHALPEVQMQQRAPAAAEATPIPIDSPAPFRMIRESRKFSLLPFLRPHHRHLLSCAAKKTMHLASDLLEGGHRMLDKLHHRRKSKRHQELLLELERARRSGAPSPEMPRLDHDASSNDLSHVDHADSDFPKPIDTREQKLVLLQRREGEDSLATKKHIERWSGSTYKAEAWEPEPKTSEDGVAATDMTNENETKAAAGIAEARSSQRRRRHQQRLQKPPPRLVLFCPHCMRNTHKGTCQRAKQHFQQQQLHQHHHQHR